jgi:integrase
MRRGELLKLQWDDINLNTGFITIRAPKGGRDAMIPLSQKARELLESIDRKESPFVFPGDKGNQRTQMYPAVSRIKKRAGLPKDFRPMHGLRHAFASMLASSGQVDIYTLQKLMTHKDFKMTQRYAHLRDETLRNASNLVGDILDEAMKEKKSATNG